MITALSLAAALWEPLARNFVRVPTPAAEQLATSKFGTRDFIVRLRGGKVEVSLQQRAPDIPFEPAVDTATMGVYSTTPSAALRVGAAWFLAYNHGEFGGGLWQFNADGSVGRRLLNLPVNSLVRYGDDVLAAAGQAMFFVKPLRIHRFTFANGKWRESSHADFPYNIIDLTNIRGELYGFAAIGQDADFAKISLSGSMRPIWKTSRDLVIANSDIAPNGDAAIGARGYVVVLHRDRSGTRADWYAPRDCVGYTPASDDMQAVDAHCIGAPGTKPYADVTLVPATGVTASRNGTWMLARGPHLLHFTGSDWREVTLPRSAYFSHIEDVDGVPFVSAPDTLWTQRAGTWTTLGQSAPCTNPFSMASGIAWCVAPKNKGWLIAGIRLNGQVVTASLASQPQLMTGGLSDDAWFTIPSTSAIGHATANGSVSQLPLTSPAAILSRGSNAIWFTETDEHHYGFIDRANRVHELSWMSDFPVRGIIASGAGAWLQESFPVGRQMLRQLNASGASTGVYLADIKSGLANGDVIYAQSSGWPTILRYSDADGLTRYRLPCIDPHIRLMPAPNNGVWFLGLKPHCSGLIENGTMQVRDLPLVRMTRYK